MEWVIDLDLISFDSLVASLERTRNRTALDQITAMRIATQADQDGYKKVVREITERCKITPDDLDDQQRFLNDFANGI